MTGSEDSAGFSWRTVGEARGCQRTCSVDLQQADEDLLAEAEVLRE